MKNGIAFLFLYVVGIYSMFISQSFLYVYLSFYLLVAIIINSSKCIRRPFVSAAIHLSLASSAIFNYLNGFIFEFIILILALIIGSQLFEGKKDKRLNGNKESIKYETIIYSIFIPFGLWFLFLLLFDDTSRLNHIMILSYYNIYINLKYTNKQKTEQLLYNMIQISIFMLISLTFMDLNKNEIIASFCLFFGLVAINKERDVEYFKIISKFFERRKH